MTTSHDDSGRRRWAALGILLIGTVFVSLITTFASLAYHGGANPATLVWSRFVGLVLVLGCLLGLTGVTFRLPKANFRATLWIGLCLLMMSAGYLASVSYIKVSLAVILLYTYPLLVAVFSAFSGRERLSPIRAVLLVVAFLGLVIALGRDIGIDLTPGAMALDPAAITLDWRGAVSALIAAFGVASLITWCGPFLENVDSRVMNFWANLWLIALMSGFVLVTGKFALPATGLGWFGYAAATLCYVAAMVCWFSSFKVLSPTDAAMTLNLEPAISLVAASIILGETTSVQQWVGTLVLLVAIILSSVLGGRHRS